MLTSTLFTTNNGELSPDMVREILANFPETRIDCPLYTELVTRGLTQPAMQPRFDWRTQPLPGRRNQVNNGGAAYDANTTAIVVDDATVYPVGHLIVSEATREVMLVTAVNLGNNTLTVTRGIGAANGGVAAAAGSVANDVWLTVIGPAAGEGSRAMAFRTLALGEGWNFTQNFRETALVSGTVAGSSTQNTPPIEQVRMEKFEIAIRNIEHALYFGSRMQTTNAAGEIVYTTHGLFNALQTHRFNVGGNLTRALLEGTYLSAMGTGSARKLFIGGPTAIFAINEIYRGTSFRVPSERLGGSQIDVIRTSMGVELVPVLSRTLRGGFAGHSLIVDVSEKTKIRHLGRPANGRTPAQSGLLQLVEGTQENDRDGVQDEWRADLGLQFGNEADHAVLTGITGGA